MAKYFGYNYPFKDLTNTKRGILPRQEDMQLIKNDVQALIFTSKGDRLNRPTFGTILKRMLFELNTDDALREIESDIASSIIAEEPRLRNTSVVAKRDGHNLTVSVSAVLSNDPSTKFLLDVQVRTPGSK